MKKKSVKRAIGLVAVVMMVLCLGMSAFAETSDTNLVLHETAYTQVKTADSDVKTFDVMVGPADSYYEFSGFDTEADALEKTDFSVVGQPTGVSVVESTTAVPVVIEVLNEDTGEMESKTVYAAKATVTVVAGQTGSYSVLAQRVERTESTQEPNPFEYAYVNATVVVQPGTAAGPASVTVRVIGTGAFQTTSATISAMSAANATENDEANEIKNQYGVINNFPTAMTALLGMVDNGNLFGVSFFNTVYQYSDYGYAYSITGKNAYNVPVLVENAGVNGWQYRVYNADNSIKADSEFIGASAYKVSAGEKVLWKYGSYTDASLFPSTYPAN